MRLVRSALVVTLAMWHDGLIRFPLGRTFSMQIRWVSARNFRGIRQMTWRLPANRVVCLVGPGDSTKTTILDAVALVLSPRWNVPFSDADFYGCDPSQPLVLQVVVGDLSDEMMRDDTFGLDLCGLTPDGELLDDPVDGAEPCVMLQLRVASDLEPEWTIVRPTSDDEGQPISARKRETFGLFRIDERVDAHLRWGRGSALSRLTAGGASDAITMAHRAARTAVFGANRSALHDAADTVAKAAASIGAAAFGELRPGLDPSVSSGSSALLLHDGAVPLTHAGLGTRRLTSIATQENVAGNGNILLIDEVESGLDPHRLLHVLQRLKTQTVAGRGQVILTTHAPLVVEALQAADISVVRSEAGVTTSVGVPDTLNEVQGALRACPAAVLARSVVVAEGKTEVGMARHLVRVWDAETGPDSVTAAALGVAIVDGVGITAPVRARIFQELGYPTALFIDNDDRTVDGDVVAAVDAGVTLVRWQYGNSTEDELASVLEFDGLCELLDLAVTVSDEEAVRDAIVSRLDKVTRPGVLDPQAWLDAGHSLDEIRSAIAAAAKRKAWFKREEPGQQLGDLVIRHWDRIGSSPVGGNLSRLRAFVYATGVAL